MDVIPSVSSASWWFLCDRWLSASAVVSCIRIVFLCNRWLWWGSVMLILRTRIVWYWCYIPCSLYQTCLVRDSASYSITNIFILTNLIYIFSRTLWSHETERSEQSGQSIQVPTAGHSAPVAIPPRMHYGNPGKLLTGPEIKCKT